MAPVIWLILSFVPGLVLTRICMDYVKKVLHHRCSRHLNLISPLKIGELTLTFESVVKPRLTVRENITIYMYESLKFVRLFFSDICYVWSVRVDIKKCIAKLYGYLCSLFKIKCLSLYDYQVLHEELFCIEMNFTDIIFKYIDLKF